MWYDIWLEIIISVCDFDVAGHRWSQMSRTTQATSEQHPTSPWCSSFVQPFHKFNFAHHKSAGCKLTILCKTAGRVGCWARVLSKYVSSEFITRGIRGVDKCLRMSCEHESLELRTKTSKTVSGVYKWGKTVSDGGTWERSMRTDEQQCLSIVLWLRGPRVHERCPKFLFTLLKYTELHIQKVWVDFW